MSRFLLITLCLPLLSGCSKTHVNVQTVPLQATLARTCQQVQPLPDPMIDPMRLQWEADLLTAYADCAARHAATVAAWPVSP